MRYTNITDQERMNESAISYDDKFKNLYKYILNISKEFSHDKVKSRHAQKVSNESSRTK